jgi:hypothetical protein
MTVQSNAFEREDRRHLVTAPDLERPAQKEPGRTAIYCR